MSYSFAAEAFDDSMSYAGGAASLVLDDGVEAARDGFVLRCGCASCIKNAQKEGVDLSALGIGAPAPTSPGPQFLGDPVPDAPHNESEYTLSTDPDARPIQATIEDGADRDLFRIELTAGQSYEVTLDVFDATGDLVLEIYDANGAPVLGPNDEPLQSDSGGAGGDESIIFTAPASGVYYVGVRPFTPTDTGNYAVSAKVSDLPPGGSVVPTDSIDWGGTQNRVNTDGVETADGDDVIHVYFAKEGEAYMSSLGPVTAVKWEEYAKDGARVAMKQYENIVNVKYVEVNSKEEADFVLIANVTAPVLLGRMSPPGEEYEGQGEFNTAGVGWTEAGLKQGGYGYVTFIHEFGHGMGLAHPHDNGGGSKIMRGVESDSDSGDFGLNQGVFTTMSYRSGYPDGPQGGSDSDDYGYEGTLGAFDVAVLQAKYGANMDYKTGDDLYVLPSENKSGTFYACLWDVGGNDTIAASGPMAAYIDLRAATLQYEEGGGGWVSYAEGIHGGFTIANGVVIENAVGGEGADRLIGNSVANGLTGGGGNDELFGQDGDDFLTGAAGEDALIGELGADQAYGGDGDDWLVGGAGADALIGEGGADELYGGEDGDWMVGGAGSDALIGDVGDDQMFGGDDGDWLDAGAGNDALIGEAGDDFLLGGEGDDWLVGGAGMDNFNGGLGSDRFVIQAMSDSVTWAPDRIVDFDSSQDLIDLSGIDADTATAGDQAFVLVTAFGGGTPGQAMLNYDGAADTTRLWLDQDGDGVVDFTLFINGRHDSGAGVLL